MLSRTLLFVGAALSLCSCSESRVSQRYLFYLHHTYPELAGAEGIHPHYGKVEYYVTVKAFQQAGFTVISELRPRGTDAQTYARKVVAQIDSLLKLGVPPSAITVVGASKGGYIAMYTSSFLKNKDMNFVFVGCCDTVEVTQVPEFDFYGKILNIYEASDTLTTPCKNLKLSDSHVPQFHEIRLQTGMMHGYLYKALPDWMDPAIDWANTQAPTTSLLSQKIDSVLADTTGFIPFSGVVLVTKGDRTLCGKITGYGNREAGSTLHLTDQFIIGSLSKQITAVLTLHEYENGRLDLHTPIGKYLPELTQDWKNTVTIHHLLTHTHGIVDLNKPLAFPSGSKFEYGNLGYELCGRILEKTSRRSVSDLSRELFELAGMKHSAFPGTELDSHRATGHVQLENGQVTSITGHIPPSAVPAGAFISTAPDLSAWNQALHHGKLLRDSTYKLMTTKKPNALRPHVALDTMEYGYGLSMDSVMIGHTGFAPGYVLFNFYFPGSDVSMIVIENVAASDIKKAYGYHARILDVVKKMQAHL